MEDKNRDSLQESEAKYRDLYDNAPDMYHTLDANGIIIDCNETEARMLGYKKEEIIGSPLINFFTDESKKLFKIDFPSLNYEKSDNITVEREFVRKDGSTFIASLNIFSEFDKNGKLLRTKTIARDVTELKQIQKALDIERQQLLSIFDSINEIIYIADPDTYEIIYINKALREQLGNVAGQKCHKAFQGMESPCSFCTNEYIFGENTGKSYIWEFQNRGDKRWYRCIDRAIRWPDGRMVRYEMAIDITERKQAEESLRESEEKYRTLFEESGDAVYITTFNGKFIAVNKAATELFGYALEEMTGMDVRKIYVKPDDRLGFQNEIAKKGYVKDLEIKFKKKNGTEMICLLTSSVRRDKDGGILGYQGIIRDITEKRRMEDELIRAEHLESLGILAGGIAHDFNNILTAILGNISLAKIHVGQREIFERLADAEKACSRAKDLTQQLLTFSKGGAPVKKTASIAEVIKDSVCFALSGSNVRCEFDLPHNLYLVDIDEGQISQVINNIVINADQSMPDGGIIKISAENITIMDEPSKSWQGEKYVRITIKDHGIGIPRQYLQKIFTPYFTTKQKGSGLGLATAYSIIKKHDGRIAVESETGRGTSFFIYLPASPRQTLKKGVEDKSFIGKGRVLIMDDEEIIREVACNALTAVGYDVAYAEDGSEAIEIYKKAKQSGRPFDVVIMDLTVPGGMGGKETIKRLLETYPDVKAIVSSGYSNDPVMSDYRNYGFRDVVGKPYNIEDLSKVVYRTIKGERDPKI